jgi:uncharacterized protein
MQRIDGSLVFSASDLAAFLECEHLAALDRAALDDAQLAAQRSARDASAELVASKGDEHERAYLSRLSAQGREVIDIAAEGGSLDAKVERTLVAMRQGVPVIYQAALRDGALAGHADFLFKVEGAHSAFGPWRYEVADTKLARSPKAKFLVQLAFYSELLAKAQRAEPMQMHVVLGDFSERSYRVADYSHYFRALLARFLASIDGAAPPYPLPCEHCQFCHWRERCEARRVADDHLCQVAGSTRVQWAKLNEAGIATLAQLAALPADASVPRIQPQTLAKLREQAHLQHRARETGARSVVLLPLDAEGRRGLHRLPAPDAGDLFFDMEGDPYEDGGLEYLFGVGHAQEDRTWTFRAFWAHDRAGERRAFEAFVDFVVARRRAHPLAHVYHYANYEESALKRLASLHATREVEVDDLLREGALVDLYKVVREGLRTSEASLSIKAIERFYRPGREGEVKDAGASIVAYERWRDTREQRLLDDIEAYNRDDVESTRQLRDWLLTLRPAGLPWKARQAEAAPPSGEEDEPPSKARQAEARLIPYRERLVETLPADRSAWGAREHARELAYQLLDFHRRAAKPAWWARYERMEMTSDELRDDPECLAGLTLDLAAPPRRERRSLRYTYQVPEQESKLADGKECTRCDTGESLGALRYDEAARRASVKVGPRKQPLPERIDLGPGKPLATDKLVDALYRFADSLLAGDGRFRALEGLLAREPPRLAGRAPGSYVVAPGADVLAASLDAVRAMDRTVLYVQGPPGAGKTHIASRLIVDLLASGQRVGVMSNSHKAINHLLAGVVRAARERGLVFAGCKKSSNGHDGSRFDGAMIVNVESNAEVWAFDHALVAGTAWLFADPAAEQRLDHLFVDEAGQVALANLVAAGLAARNCVLLGDQMQLAQPVQGVHPGRSGDSALDWLLDGAATIAPERGIFLPTSWRMHPSLCRFVSDAVYDGRLEPEPHNARCALVLARDAHPLLRAAGLVHAPIEHEGCSQRSEEEAALVAELYASALRQRYTDRDGAEHPMTPENILLVAPYNMQVNLLASRLPKGARVGTVDKFQGQEAELVIVSMTTSSEHDLPRFMQFLYSKQRLNVAISRARCTAIVVANPALTAIKCRTPEQMALVNTLCRVAEARASAHPYR